MLAGAIFDAAGQPATIRVGVVEGVAPLRVNVQGTIVQGESLGRIGTLPALGDTVLLIGQSVRGASSSASTWICLGQILPTT